ncbi:hypothetical protein AB7M35_003719 [Amorphus suaedae]
MLGYFWLHDPRHRAVVHRAHGLHGRALRSLAHRLFRLGRG